MATLLHRSDVRSTPVVLRRRAWSSWWLILLLGWSGLVIAEPAFHVEHFVAIPRNNAVEIHAQVQIGKEALLQEILNQGQTLVWVVEAEWREPEPFAFIPGVGVHTRRQLRWRIHYYPLTNQYALENGKQAPMRFTHWQEVIDTLNHISAFTLPLEHGAARGRVALRVYVDIQSLPLPLRLRALLDHWKLESAWIVSAPLSS